MVYGLLQKIPAGIHLLLFITTLQRGGTCAAQGIEAKLVLKASKKISGPAHFYLLKLSVFKKLRPGGHRGRF